MPKSVLAPLRVLLASTSPRTRVGLALIALIGIVVRLALLVTARDIGRSALAGAVIASLGLGAALAVQRLLQARVRVDVECDLHRAFMRALLEADVLDAPVADLQRVVLEGDFRARAIVSTALPQLAADVIVSLVVLPYLAFLLPPRVLGISVLALAFVLVTVVALRRVTQRANDAVLAASQQVYDHVLVGIEGRLEIAARGGEAELRGRLDRALERYAEVATRAGFRGALAGRAPLAVGAAIIGATLALDATMREAFGVAVLGDALLLAACLPAIMGTASGMHEIVRSSSLIAPLTAILEASPRPELAREGAKPPTSPCDVVFDAVSFRYRENELPTFESVSARWTTGAALFVEGANGAGKSTLLRLLLGLRAPTAGTITFGGIDLQAIDPLAYRRCAAYLPQQPYLGEAHVTVASAMRIAAPDAADRVLLETLARVNVLDALERRSATPLDVTIGTLSAGQRQRLALARVLAQDASLVLLDEPDAYLDSAGMKLVAHIIEDLVAAGKMVAVAAHSPELAVEGAVRITVKSER